MKTKGWLESPKEFKTKGKYFQWLSSMIRNIWKVYPIKLEFKKSQMIPLPKHMKHLFRGNTKRIGECQHCKDWFVSSKLEVDHIIPIGQLTELDHVYPYLDRTLCTRHNMQLLCLPCHKIKTYADEHSMSFEEARFEKEVIKYINLTVVKQKTILKEHKLTEEEISNDTKRRNAFRELLKEEKICYLKIN